MTYVRWSIWNMLFFIGFRSLVTSQWYFEKVNYIKTQCPVCLINAMRKDDIKAWGKRRYWRVIGMQEVGIKLLKLAKTCHHTQLDSFVPFWGCAQSKEAIQGHWLIDYSTVSAFWVYAIERKMQALQVGTMEQSIRQARGQAWVWEYFSAALITESGLSYKPRIVICHIKEITAILSPTRGTR